MDKFFFRTRKLLLEYLYDQPIRAGIRKYKIDKLNSIFSHTSKQELRMLYKLACTVPERSCCVEIGSYLGASTNYIAMGISGRSSMLFCVDTWQNETMPDGERDTYSEFINNTAPFSSFIVPVRKRSEELNSIDLPNEIAFAFIDGDHSYQAVNRDFRFLSELITSKGIIAFHDHRYFVGVTKTVGEALLSGNWVLAGVVENLCWIRRRENIR